MVIEFSEEVCLKELAEHKEAFEKQAKALAKQLAESQEELKKEAEIFARDTEILEKEQKALEIEKKKNKILEAKLERTLATKQIHETKRAIIKETEVLRKEAVIVANQKRAFAKEKRKKNIVEKLLEETLKKEKESFEEEEAKKRILKEKQLEVERLKNEIALEQGRQAVRDDSKEKPIDEKKKAVPNPKCCWFCGEDEAKLYKCKGCHKAYYCNTNCIEQDWPVHGEWCTKRKQKREKRENKMKEEILSRV